VILVLLDFLVHKVNENDKSRELLVNQKFDLFKVIVELKVNQVQKVCGRNNFVFF
jgi:hypothetical protein